MKKTRPPSVEEFLRNQTRDSRWRGGTPCQTCTHKKVNEINRELRVFAKAKEGGHAMPWSRFFRDRLEPVYGLKLVSTAIMRHVRDCMGVN